MQRAFTPSFDSKTLEATKRRRPSESLIPVPKLNVTSNSRPGTALSMSYSHHSGSPSQSVDGTGRKSPRESPSAWRSKDSPSNPFNKDSSPPARAGARSQTPEAMLRSRALHLPVYLEGNNASPSPGASNATPGTKARQNAPSSFKGEAKTLVFGPGPSNSGANGTSAGARPSSRTTSRNASYGFGRMTPSLDGAPPYVAVKTDELDVEVAKVVNGMAHGFL